MAQEWKIQISIGGGFYRTLPQTYLGNEKAEWIIEKENIKKARVVRCAYGAEQDAPAIGNLKIGSIAIGSDGRRVRVTGPGRSPATFSGVDISEAGGALFDGWERRCFEPIKRREARSRAARVTVIAGGA